MFTNALRAQARLVFPTCKRSATVSAARCLHMLSNNASRTSLSLIHNKFSPNILIRGFRYEAVENNRPTETLFVSNVPWDAVENDLIDVFSTFGTVVEARLVRDEEGDSLGYGHVIFENLEDAIKARKASDNMPIRVHGRNVRVLYNVHQRSKSDTLVIRTEKAMEDNEVRDMFPNYNITNVRFVPPSGRFRTSLIFVQFDSAANASRALDIIRRMKGESIDIVYAKPRRGGTLADLKSGGTLADLKGARTSADLKSGGTLADLKGARPLADLKGRRRGDS